MITSPPPAPPKAPARWLPLAAILVTVVAWASAFVAIRHVGHSISPGGLALGRTVVGTVVLGILVAFRGRKAPLTTTRRWPAGRDWPRLLVIGVLWFGLYNLALNTAERHVDAGTAAMVVNVGPLIIAVLAGFLLREGFPRQVLAGCAVAFGGVVLIGFSTSRSGSDAAGIALCLASAVFYAVAVITQKPLLADLPGLNVTWIACGIGALTCMPYAPALARDLSHATLGSIWWIVYLGAFPTALGFTTWAYALARSSAGRIGASTYLVPAIAVAMSWLWLGETPAALALAGGVVCLLGVYIARRSPSWRRPAPAGRGMADHQDGAAGRPEAVEARP